MVGLYVWLGFAGILFTVVSLYAVLLELKGMTSGRGNREALSLLVAVALVSLMWPILLAWLISAVVVEILRRKRNLVNRGGDGRLKNLAGVPYVKDRVNKYQHQDEQSEK